MWKIKNFVVRKTKNLNPIKTKNKKITYTQILFYPICSFWVNMLCVMIYTNIILLIPIFGIYIVVHVTYSVPILSFFINFFMALSIVIFRVESVFPNKNHPDELEKILEKIATPDIFKKFLYAKRTARLQEKQYAYLLREELNEKKKK